MPASFPSPPPPLTHSNTMHVDTASSISAPFDSQLPLSISSGDVIMEPFSLLSSSNRTTSTAEQVFKRPRVTVGIVTVGSVTVGSDSSGSLASHSLAASHLLQGTQLEEWNVKQKGSTVKMHVY